MSSKPTQNTDKPQMGRIFIPVDPLNADERELTLSINGQRCDLPLGRLVTAPADFCRLAVVCGRANHYEPLD